MDVTVCRGLASHLHRSALHSLLLRPAGVAGQPACSCRDVRVQASACARHHKPYFFFVLLDGMLSEMPPHELPTPEPAELALPRAATARIAGARAAGARAAAAARLAAVDAAAVRAAAELPPSRRRAAAAELPSSRRRAAAAEPPPSEPPLSRRPLPARGTCVCFVLLVADVLLAQVFFNQYDVKQEKKSPHYV